ncbi:hypothetical protein BDV06DRAFT_190993 [Aspergillus oleicola]
MLSKAVFWRFIIIFPITCGNSYTQRSSNTLNRINLPAASRLARHFVWHADLSVIPESG